jgi:hypothetical protein
VGIEQASQAVEKTGLAALGSQLAWAAAVVCWLQAQAERHNFHKTSHLVY